MLPARRAALTPVAAEPVPAAACREWWRPRAGYPGGAPAAEAAIGALTLRARRGGSRRRDAACLPRRAIEAVIPVGSVSSAETAASPRSTSAARAARAAGRSGLLITRASAPRPAAGTRRLPVCGGVNEGARLDPEIVEGMDHRGAVADDPQHIVVVERQVASDDEERVVAGTRCGDGNAIERRRRAGLRRVEQKLVGRG